MPNSDSFSVQDYYMYVTDVEEMVKKLVDHDIDFAQYDNLIMDCYIDDVNFEDCANQIVSYDASAKTPISTEIEVKSCDGCDESTKQIITAEDLLDEGRVKDFFKAAALGTALALSPVHAGGAQHELKVSELPADLQADYNVLQKTPVLNLATAQALADEALSQVGEEAVHQDPSTTEAWGNAKATYEYLVKQDHYLATAFLGKFNVNAKKLFGVQIPAIAKQDVHTESIDLPVRAEYLTESEPLWNDNARGTDDFEAWKQKVIDLMNDGMLDLAVMSDKDIEECNKLLKYYFKQKSLPPKGAARWISIDLKRFMQTGKSKFKSKEQIEFEKQAEENLRQAYLASDDYKKSQDPGWRGPNGTWSND